MIKKLILLIAVVILTACSSIPSDPIKGSDKLFESLKECAASDDYKEASFLMEKYLTAYKSDEDKGKFFLNLMYEVKNPTDRRVGEFMQNADLQAYPIFREYMEEIIAYSKALEAQEASKNQPQLSYKGTPKEEALLFCSLLTDYAREDDYDNAMSAISKIYEKYKNAPSTSRAEFFTTFRDYIKESGEPGKTLYTFLTTMPKNQTLTDFMKLSLESLNE